MDEFISLIGFYLPTKNHSQYIGNNADFFAI